MERGAQMGEGVVLGIESMVVNSSEAGRALALSASEAMADGISAGMNRLKTELDSARELFSQYGMVFGNDLAKGMAGTMKGVGMASGDLGSAALDGLYDRLLSNVEGRVASLQGMGDRIRENHAMTSGNMQSNADRSARDERIEMHFTNELDGRAMGEWVTEVAYGPFQQAVNRRGAGRRRSGA
jgi:hypothetical protein